MPNFSAQDWFHAITARRHDVISVHLKTFAGKRNIFGETGLMCAVRQGDAEAVRILAPKECGILSQTSHSTALMLACEADNAGIVEILAPFEHKDSMPDGKTAFMVAAHAGAINCINIMLKYGTREPDQNNHTALDYAVMSLNQGIVVSLAFSSIFKPDDFRQAIRTAGECKNVFAPKILRLALQYLTGQESDVPDLTFEVENLNKEIASFRACLQEVMGENRSYYLNTFNGQVEPSNLLITRFVEHMHRMQSQMEELAATTAASQMEPMKGRSKTSAKKDKSSIYELEEENVRLRTKAAALEYIIRSPIFKSHMGYNLTPEDICDRINADMIQNTVYIKELERQIKDMRAERQREMNQVSSLIGLKGDYEEALEKLRETQNLLDNRTDQLRTYRTYMGERSPFAAQVEPNFTFRQRTMRATGESLLTESTRGPDSSNTQNKHTDRQLTRDFQQNNSSRYYSTDSGRPDSSSNKAYDSTMADQSNVVREVTTVTTTTKTYSPNQTHSQTKDTCRRSVSRNVSRTNHEKYTTEKEVTRDKSLTNSFGLDNSIRSVQAMSDLSASRRRRLRPAVDPTPNGSYHSFNTSRSIDRDRAARNTPGSYISPASSTHHSEHHSLYNSNVAMDNLQEVKTSFESHIERDYGDKYMGGGPRESTLRDSFSKASVNYDAYTSHGTAMVNRDMQDHDASHIDPPSLLTSTSFVDRVKSAQPLRHHQERVYSDPVYSAITDRNNSSLDRRPSWEYRNVKSADRWTDPHSRAL